MKKIGIDARLFSQTGVGTYIRNLIYYLMQEDTNELVFYLYILPQDREALPALPRNFIIRISPYKWHTFQEQTLFCYAILKDKLDLMHFTYFGFPILYRKPFISTIHDITPILFKTGKASTRGKLIYEIKMLAFRIVLYCQVRYSKMIITPSMAIKKSLIQLYGKTCEQKIISIYEGVDYLLIKSKENILLQTKFSFPFFIYVGNFYPHKNIHRLIQAFLEVKTDAKLVLIGPKDYFTSKIQSEVRRLNSENKIIFFHNATTSDLKFFYKKAKALIHPSLSEGFGLPIIEAKSFNCPIIVSDIPVFHELVDNYAIYFDPLDKIDIKNKINHFIENGNIRCSDKVNSQMSFKSMTRKICLLYKRSIKGQ